MRICTLFSHVIRTSAAVGLLAATGGLSADDQYDPPTSGSLLQPAITPAPSAPIPLVPTLVPLPAPQPPAPPALDAPLMQRSTIGGDLLGLRTALGEGGVKVDFSNTQYYQGNVKGGFQQGFEYGGRNDLFVNVAGEKAGLWKGLLIDLHAEDRYGEAVNGLTGTLLPPNLMLALPQATGATPSLTGIKVTQFLSEDLLVYGGKINTLDGFRQPITNASGLNGFMNTSLMFNPIYARTVPYSTWGAGFAYLKNQQPLFSLAILDTNNTPTTTGFESFFNNGVTIFSQLNLQTQFFEMPGHQGISGTYSTGTYTALQPTPYFDPNAGRIVIPTSQETGSWSLAYNVDQALYVSPDDPRRMWGVFGNLGIADQNPSPIRWFSSAGVTGASPLRSRPLDTFGIGYSYTGISDRLKEVAPKALPLNNEQAIELFYNVGVTQWFHVTPDLQVLDPFLGASNTSLLVGMRAKLDF